MHTLIHTPLYTRKHKWSEISSLAFSHTLFRSTSNPCWGFRIMNSDSAPHHARTLGEWYQKAFNQHPLGPGFWSETAGNLIRRDYNQSKEWMQGSPAMAASLPSVTRSQHIKGEWAKSSQHSRCIIMCNQHKMCTSAVAKCAARQWASQHGLLFFQQRWETQRACTRFLPLSENVWQ